MKSHTSFLESYLDRRVDDIQAINGGSICSVYRVTAGPDHWCLKTRAGAPVDFFEAERAGLEALGAGGEVRVPTVIYCDRERLMLEWLQPAVPRVADNAVLGRQLAALHQRPVAGFGFHRDNYCGLSPQENSRFDDGYDFFARCRLLPQGKRAHAAGLLGSGDLERLESLAGNLPRWIPQQPPSLIHGDLWSGNIHFSHQGPALIDPATHQGWAEADLAMTRLFGSPHDSFYDAYRERRPLTPGFSDRVPLYNLYHLLNHLNLFGAGWLPGVRSVLDRFA